MCHSVCHCIRDWDAIVVYEDHAGFPVNLNASVSYGLAYYSAAAAAAAASAV